MESFPTISKFVRGSRIFSNQNYMKTFFITILFNLILFTNAATAQDNGSVFGKVTDASTNEELIGANIFLDGTTIGAATDIEGNYYIKNIPAGEYTLVASMIGYSKLTITKLSVKPKDNKQLDFSLTPEALQTEEVVVTAEALKNTEVSVLKIQKNSANIVDGVSSELISKNNSSDGTDILKRMTGVTISDGKYAYVRGVGDRYNNTLLNGSSLPSTDPEKKSFSYDIIPAGMIENVITAKTFTPDKPGDFSGGLVQINTVDFPNSFKLIFDASTGYNSNSTFNSFTTYSGGKTDFLGFDDGTRNMPGTINDIRVARGNYTDAQLQNIGLSFKNNWNTNTTKAPLNGSIKFTIGDKYDLGENVFGYIGTLDYSNSTSISDRQKNFYDLDGARYLYSGVSNTNSVVASGMLNLSYKFFGSNKISFKNLINQNSDDETTIYNGEYRYADQYRDITSLRFVSRTLQSHQFIGEHFFNLMNGITWDWSASYSRSLRDEPDARRYVYSRGLGNPNDPLMFLLDQSLTTRYYSNLSDYDHNYTTNFALKPFVNPELPKFSFGILYNKKDRSFDARVFGFRNSFAPGYSYNKDSILVLPVDRIFQPENISPGFITVSEITKPSDSYSSYQKIAAGYLMFDSNILNSFRLVAGARYEYSEQYMDSYTITNEVVKVHDFYRDWLPSINLTYLLNEDINIRFAYSRTLARPEFREKAPFQYFDFLANELVEGNPDLTRALITNYDLRFELFPGAGELVAISFFYKKFVNPIELILLASSANEPIRSYENAKSANNIGAELELRKNLSFIGSTFNNFSLVTNISVIHSRIQLDEGASGSFQETDRPLQGQAPYIFNIGLYYDNFDLGWNATVTYNRVGERISKVGYADVGDIVEQPVDLIDLSVSKRLLEKFTIKLSAMDILNQNRNFIQRTPDGDKIAESYSYGRTLKLGINYQL